TPSSLLPYTTLFRSQDAEHLRERVAEDAADHDLPDERQHDLREHRDEDDTQERAEVREVLVEAVRQRGSDLRAGGRATPGTPGQIGRAHVRTPVTDQ